MKTSRLKTVDIECSFGPYDELSNKPSSQLLDELIDTILDNAWTEKTDNGVFVSALNNTITISYPPRKHRWILRIIRKAINHTCSNEDGSFFVLSFGEETWMET